MDVFAIADRLVQEYDRDAAGEALLQLVAARRSSDVRAERRWLAVLEAVMDMQAPHRDGAALH
jgi:hypothetical protein